MDLRKKEIKSRLSIRIIVCLLVFIAVILLIGVNVEKVKGATDDPFNTDNDEYKKLLDPNEWDAKNKQQIENNLKSMPSSANSDKITLFNEVWSTAIPEQRKKLLETLSPEVRKKLVNVLTEKNIPKLWDALNTDAAKTQFLKDIEPKKSEITKENAENAYKEVAKVFNSLTDDKRDDFAKKYLNVLNEGKGRKADGKFKDGSKIEIKTAKGFDNKDVKLNNDGVFNIGSKLWDPEHSTTIWTKEIQADVDKDGKGSIIQDLEVNINGKVSKSTLVDSLKGTNGKAINEYGQLEVLKNNELKPIAGLVYSNNGGKVTVSDEVWGLAGLANPPTKISLEKGTENPFVLVGNNLFITRSGQSSGSVVVDNNANALKAENMGFFVMPEKYPQSLNEYYANTKNSEYSGKLDTIYNDIGKINPEVYFESKNNKPFAVLDGQGSAESLKSLKSFYNDNNLAEGYKAKDLAYIELRRTNVDGPTKVPFEVWQGANPSQCTGPGCGPGGCPGGVCPTTPTYPTTPITPTITPISVQSLPEWAEKLNFELHNIDGMNIIRSPGQQIGEIVAYDSNNVDVTNIKQNGVLSSEVGVVMSIDKWTNTRGQEVNAIALLRSGQNWNAPDIKNELVQRIEANTPVVPEVKTNPATETSGETNSVVAEPKTTAPISSGARSTIDGLAEKGIASRLGTAPKINPETTPETPPITPPEKQPTTTPPDEDDIYNQPTKTEVTVATTPKAEITTPEKPPAKTPEKTETSTADITFAGVAPVEKNPETAPRIDMTGSERISNIGVTNVGNPPIGTTPTGKTSYGNYYNSQQGIVSLNDYNKDYKPSTKREGYFTAQVGAGLVEYISFEKLAQVSNGKEVSVRVTEPSWCGICRSELQTSSAQAKANTFYITMDQARALGRSVSSVPTTLKYKNGKLY